MRFLSIREFRSNTADVRKKLESEREIVLTSNGKPFAILTPVEPDTVEDQALAIRSARAHVAVDRVRRRARTVGLEQLSMDDIHAETQAARKARRKGAE